MTRTLILAVSILLVTCPLQAASQVDARTITIRLIATEDSGKTIEDRAPELVTSKGDVIVVNSLLRNAVAQLGRPKGAVVGGDSATFTVATSRQGDLRIEMHLPGGILWAGGRVRFGPVQTYSVTVGQGGSDTLAAQESHVPSERAATEGSRSTACVCRSHRAAMLVALFRQATNLVVGVLT